MISRARAFTLMELVVVLTLSGLLGVMAALALDSLADTTSSAVNRSKAREELRAVAESTSRTLASARPLGACYDRPPTGSNPPDRSTPASVCNKPGEWGAALELATPTEVVYYSYAEDTSGATSAATPSEALVPQRVQLRIEGNELVFAAFGAKGGASYTTVVPGAAGFESTPARARSASGVDQAGTPLLTYYDDSGARLGVTTGGVLSDSERSQVALVALTPRIAYKDPTARRNGGENAVVSDRVLIALSGSRLAREGTWNG